MKDVERNVDLAIRIAVVVSIVMLSCVLSRGSCRASAWLIVKSKARLHFTRLTVGVGGCMSE